MRGLARGSWPTVREDREYPTTRVEQTHNTPTMVRIGPAALGDLSDSEMGAGDSRSFSYHSTKIREVKGHGSKSALTSLVKASCQVGGTIDSQPMRNFHDTVNRVSVYGGGWSSSKRRDSECPCDGHRKTCASSAHLFREPSASAQEKLA